MRWKDKVRKGMRNFDIDEAMWFHAAQERVSWRVQCKQGLAECTKTKKRVEADSARHAAATGGGELNEFRVVLILVTV